MEKTQFSSRRIVTISELEKIGLQPRGNFADLLIYTSKDKGYLLERINSNEFKVYLEYDSRRREFGLYTKQGYMKEQV